MTWGLWGLDNSRLAGANGDLPPLKYKYYGIHPFLGDHWLEAEHDGKTVGRMYWATDEHPEPGKIMLMQVHPDYRRRGIASEMVRAARDNVNPNIQFSPSVSPDGKAWSQANGYEPPEGHWNDLKPRDDESEWRESHTAARLAMPLPLPQGITFHYKTEPHRVEADHDGRTVGYLRWESHFDPPTVDFVRVHPNYQRHGVATALWDRAREIEPNLQHSDNLSDEGGRWVEHEQSHTAARLAMPWYHRTDDELNPGDHLLPYNEVNPDHPEVGTESWNPNKVYIYQGEENDSSDHAPYGGYGRHIYEIEPHGEPERDYGDGNYSSHMIDRGTVVKRLPEEEHDPDEYDRGLREYRDKMSNTCGLSCPANCNKHLFDYYGFPHTAARLAMPYDFNVPHGEFQMPVERNEHGHVRVHRGIVVPRNHLDDLSSLHHDYGVHWSTNEQISQALADPAVYGENDDDVGLLMSGWYDPAHGTHPDPDPITGGPGYNEHEQEITMSPGTPVHVDRARWKHPDWNYDHWDDVPSWQPRNVTATKEARTMTAAITVYTQPSCVQCDMTKKLLERMKVEHTTVDVTADPDAHAYVTGLGYSQAPVVVVGDGESHWAGFKPEKLRGLVE